MPALRLRPFLLVGLVASAIFAACGPTRRSALPVGPLGDSDPVAAIIERRPELQLADTQVAALRVIKHELERVNKPLREELERMGIIQRVEPMRRVPEQPTKEQREKGKPLLEQLRDNNQRARAAALELLTATQRTRLDSLDRAIRSRREQGQRARQPS